jgi:hypothetical protein
LTNSSLDFDTYFYTTLLYSYLCWIYDFFAPFLTQKSPSLFSSFSHYSFFRLSWYKYEIFIIINETNLCQEIYKTHKVYPSYQPNYFIYKSNYWSLA